MITPGTPPEGAYVPGPMLGPDNRGVPAGDAVAAAKAQMTAPYLSSYGGIGQVLIDTLGGILQSVMNGIVAGAQALGMIVSNVIDTISGAIQWLVDGIAAVFGGVGSFAPGSVLAEANDRQLAINHRLDLMEDVSGYIATYMKENHYKTRDTWHVMPFNGQLGPKKNADLILDGSFENCLWLAKGTWVISVQIAHDQHADRRESIVRLTGYTPSLEVFTSKEAHYEVLPDKKQTLAVQHTVVVPDDGGLYLLVTAKYNVNTLGGVYPKLRYLGGTHMTHLTAHRLNLDTSNAVREEDVPTIGTE